MTTITMIDYGSGNIRSVQKAFEHIGTAVKLTADPHEVVQASRLVLPGVGAFGAGIAAVRHRGLEPAIHEAVKKGIPMLGICVGMQFLFDESEEMGRHTGLGLVAGQVKRFPENGLKVPHMGWNQLDHPETHPLLKGVPNGAYTYFVHSYYCAPTNSEDMVARTDYGIAFASIIGRENVFGLQFHPEKSQKVGLHILKNFLTV